MAGNIYGVDPIDIVVSPGRTVGKPILEHLKNNTVGNMRLPEISTYTVGEFGLIRNYLYKIP